MRIFAGPWVGEFGWELFGWQGYLRQIARTYESAEFIVASRPGHDILYHDFRDRYVPYLVDSVKTDMWQCRDWVYDNIHQQFIGPGDIYISPRDIHIHKKYTKQLFIGYGAYREDVAYDIVYHARSTAKFNTGYRNWPKENWIGLFRRFPDKKICAIGSRNGSLWIEGTVDKRGCALSEVVDILASSSLLIGPSSGPMHLGSLCGIRHIVWTDDCNWIIKNRARYEEKWNPFKTEVFVIDDVNWQPNVERVESIIHSFGDII